MAIRRRGAFTLVELLVVITIIGMLMALLLPAVNAAVEAGRNTQCQNNIRQLAMAVNGFQTSAGYYPAYTTPMGAPTPQPVSWVVVLLPQFERLDLQKDWSDSSIPVASKSPYLELLVCPSDPPEQIGQPELSYVANSGCATNTSGQEAHNGIFHTSTIQCTADSIVDGKSNTICFSENVLAGKWNVAARETTTFVWQSGTLANEAKLTTQNLPTLTPTINTAKPQSWHSGGMNVAFCDSHVYFMKSEVDYGVYCQLMTPNYRDSADVTTLAGTFPKAKQPLNDADK